MCNAIDPQRKFEFRTPLAVGTLAVSGTTGRRMGGKCGTLPGLFSGQPACSSPIPLARAMRSTSFQTGINHFRRVNAFLETRLGSRECTGAPVGTATCSDNRLLPPVFGLAIGYETSALRRLFTP